MWLTVNFSDLCRCTYTYYAYPPYGPCLPANVCLYAYRLRIMLVGEQAWYRHIHHAWENLNNFNSISTIDNCYVISCHALAWRKEWNFHKRDVLQQPITKYPTPYGGGGWLNRPTLDSLKGSRVSCTNCGIEDTCSHTGNGRRRGSREAEITYSISPCYR